MMILSILMGLVVVMAAVGSIAIAGWTWFAFRKWQKRLLFRAVLVCAAFPMVALLGAGIGLEVYSKWCEHVRGVDFGDEDYYRVPVGADYSLEMFVGEEGAVLSAPGMDAVDIERLGLNKLSIYAETKSGTFILIDKKSGNLDLGLSTEELNRALLSRGMPTASLLPPSEIYDDLRGGGADVVWGILILAIPGYLAYATFAFVRKLEQENEQRGETGRSGEVRV